MNGHGTVHRRALAAACVGVLCGMLGSCTVGPDFRRPVTQPPSQYGSEPSDVTSRTFGGAVDTRWWDSFHDPELSSLVERLACQNLDLKSAAERVLQGRAQRQVTRSQGLPMVDGQASYMRDRLSPKGILQNQVSAPGAPLEYDVIQDGFSASWELDLFGRVRRGVEAADADTEAAIESRHGVALSAFAELAQDYMQLRGTQARRAITNSNLEAAQQNTRLVWARFTVGVGTTLEVAQAKAQQATISSTLPALRTSEVQLINAIGLLLAEQPRALEQELSKPSVQPAVPPRVPVGLPGMLTRQRPDVREAEARLHAATAQTGVAVASFYPDVTLTGSFELQGLRLADAFALPERAFSVGPSVDLPIFEGGRLRGTLRMRKSQQREAAIAFQKTVLQAWQDVDNALTSYAEAQHARVQVAEAAQQNEIALSAARAQYTAGATDFLNVLSSQTSLLQSQSSLAESDTQIETSLIAVYRALGGGWQLSDEK